MMIGVVTFFIVFGCPHYLLFIMCIDWIGVCLHYIIYYLFLVAASNMHCICAEPFSFGGPWPCTFFLAAGGYPAAAGGRLRPRRRRLCCCCCCWARGGFV